jgi:hypothetical protein
MSMQTYNCRVLESGPLDHAWESFQRLRKGVLAQGGFNDSYVVVVVVFVVFRSQT